MLKIKMYALGLAQGERRAARADTNDIFYVVNNDAYRIYESAKMESFPVHLCFPVHLVLKLYGLIIGGKRSTNSSYREIVVGVLVVCLLLDCGISVFQCKRMVFVHGY